MEACRRADAAKANYYYCYSLHTKALPYVIPTRMRTRNIIHLIVLSPLPVNFHHVTRSFVW